MPPAQPSTDLGDGAPVTQVFPLTSSQTLIDMVWIIDDTGSMGKYAAIVRQNFSSFVASIANRADIRLALISKGDDGSQEDGIGVSLPPELLGQGGVQSDSFVGNFDEMALAAMATCGASASAVVNGEPSVTVCGREIARPAAEFARAPAIAGALTPFFRPQSSKVFVVVSDDNAEGVDDTNFVSLVTPALGRAPTVYGFVGTDASSCRISHVGTTYINLAQATGGEVFDLCEADWTNNFAKLGQTVVNNATSTFDLTAAKVAAVVSATVDGAAIAAANVHLNGTAVTIDAGAIPGGARSVTIVYRPGH